MSRWTEILENHPIHETLNWAKECVQSEADDISDEEVIEKRRFLKLISHHEEILGNIDAEMVPMDQIDTLNNQFRHQNISAQLEAYKSSGNLSNLKNANDHISNHLTPLSLLSGLASEKASSMPLNDLEGLIDQTSQALVKKKDKAEKELEKLSNSVADSQQKLSELQEAIKTNNTQMSTQITEWQNQFSTAQETRNKSFTEWRDDFTSEKNSEIAELIEKYDQQAENNKEKFVKQLEILLKDGESKHQAILDLYQLTAGDSVGAGYLKSANEEKKQADIWRRISIGFISFTVIWLLYAYNNNTPGNINKILDVVPVAEVKEPSAIGEKKPNQSAVRNHSVASNSDNDLSFPWFKLFLTFSISGVLLWGSAYSAQQSTKHRKNEKRTRWFALEVKAIDPFISSLKPEEQSELKKQLSERIFGQFSESDDDKSNVVDEHALKALSDAVGGIISKLPK